MKKTQVSRARPGARQLSKKSRARGPARPGPSCPGVRGSACRTSLEAAGEAGAAREPQPPGPGEPGQEEWKG